MKSDGGSRYFTHGHNVEACLRNGSYVRQDGKRIVEHMNGDYMGEIAAVPASMVEVDAENARRLLPNCCK